MCTNIFKNDLLSLFSLVVCKWFKDTIQHWTTNKWAHPGESLTLFSQQWSAVCRSLSRGRNPWKSPLPVNLSMNDATVLVLSVQLFLAETASLKTSLYFGSYNHSTTSSWCSQTHRYRKCNVDVPIGVPHDLWISALCPSVVFYNGLHLLTRVATLMRGCSYIYLRI